VLRQLEAHRGAHAGAGEPPALVVRLRPPISVAAALFISAARAHALFLTPPSRRAAQVGISAPQGCGKTTLVGQLTELLCAEGHAAASVSLDDFYLTGAQQEALAASAPDNELLRFRGNAGTHDLALASDTLGACAAARARACAWR
jgi:hypothetical protein